MLLAMMGLLGAGGEKSRIFTPAHTLNNDAARPPRLHVKYRQSHPPSVPLDLWNLVP
jgi:hypothetical protein